MFGLRPPEAQASTTRADLAACRTALRHGSKTFLAASLLLPRSVHEPASALYAFCRLADDAVDTEADRGQAVARLRKRLQLAYAGTPQDAAADRALAQVVARHHIPAALFDALLEGFEWDLDGRCYETLEQLHDYAARVAGAVGAMMALLMGVRSADGLARACDLGVAMQLSNIARDVGEDARMGRLYLPRAWMRQAGLDPDMWLAQPVFSPALGAVVQRLLDAADELYQRADGGVARLPLACRPGINAARFMYAAIGHEVAR
ncbi:MAG: phytoene/squalene synthase family protein, partial [Ideonella sp.]